MRLRALPVLAVALALPAAAAAQQRLPLTAVPGLTVADVAAEVRAGGAPGPYAVGLLVPDAGPETSNARALESLVRGRVRNSLHRDPPSGPVLVELTPEDAWEPPGIVAGVPEGGLQRNDRRYAVLVFGEGWDGLLTSETTRIPGLVSVVDLAPTARGEEGALGSTPRDRPLAALLELDERIDANARGRLPATALAAALLALLALVHPAGAVLGFATGAAANLALGALGISEPLATIPVLALATLAGAALAEALRGPVARGLVLAGVLAAYLVALLADPAWVALSPAGPAQSGRFHGISNLLATLLLVPALAAGALLWRRWGVAGLVAVALLAITTVGAGRLGADGGGALVLAAGFAVLGAGLAGWRRRAWALGLAGAAAAVALLGLDALAGPATHVGDSVRGGPGAVLSDLGSRLELSAARATAHWSAGLAVAAALAALVALLILSRRRGLLSPLPLAFAVAIGVSLLVNDSPGDVAVGGLVGLLALVRFAGGEEGAPGYTEAR